MEDEGHAWDKLPSSGDVEMVGAMRIPNPPSSGSDWTDMVGKEMQIDSNADSCSTE